MNTAAMDETIERLIRDQSHKSPYEQEQMYYELMFAKKSKKNGTTQQADLRHLVEHCLDMPVLSKKKANKSSSTASSSSSSSSVSSSKKKKALFICKLCKSENVNWSQKQTRSADEAMTVFLECANCGAKWRQ